MTEPQVNLAFPTTEFRPPEESFTLGSSYFTAGTGNEYLLNYYYASLLSLHFIMFIAIIKLQHYLKKLLLEKHSNNVIIPKEEK